MKMRKKIFAILMTIMMMVTFMPNMAFATLSASDNIILTNLKNYEMDFGNFTCDPKDYVVDESGYVQNFEPNGVFNIKISEKAQVPNGAYTLKASATKGVTLYFSFDEKAFFAFPSNGIEYEMSADAGGWQGPPTEIMIVPVVKNELPKSKAFNVDFSLTDEAGKKVNTVTTTFKGKDAEAKIGDMYYQYLGAAIPDVKAGQTVTLLKENINIDKAANIAKMLGKKSFTIDGNDYKVYVSNLGEGITYKKMMIVGTDEYTLVGNNTVLKDCFVVNNLKVTEDSTGVKFVDIIINGSFRIDEGSEVKFAGYLFFSENSEHTEISKDMQITINAEKYAKVDVSDVDEYYNIDIWVEYPKKTQVTLNDDERWLYDDEWSVYCLIGKYVYKGKTYYYWDNPESEDDVVAAIGKNRDLNPAVKIINYTDDVIGPTTKNQTLTLTGTVNSNVAYLNDSLPENSKLIIKSGNYDSWAGPMEDFLSDTKSSYMYQDNYNDNNHYITSDRYVVGGDLILKELNPEDGYQGTNTRIVSLGNDLTAEKLCEQVDKFQETSPDYMIWVDKKLAKDLLAVGKEYKLDLTKYIRQLYNSAVDIPLKSGKHIILTQEEYNDFEANYNTVSRCVKQTKPTIKSTSVSTSSAKLTANKGFKVEVAGKTGTVTGLKAGAIKTYTVKPFMTIGNGKYKIYGKSQSVVVKSKAYTPTVKVGRKTLKVSFKKMSGAKKYQVSVSRSKTKKNVKSYSAKRSVKIKNLKSNKTYYVKVRTVDSKGRKGAWSVVKAVKVK